MMCNELSCPQWDNFPFIVAIPSLTLLPFHEIFQKHEETLFLIFVLDLATHSFFDALLTALGTADCKNVKGATNIKLFGFRDTLDWLCSNLYMHAWLSHIVEGQLL